MKPFEALSIRKRFTIVLIMVISLTFIVISSVFILWGQKSLENELLAHLRDATSLARDSLSSALWQYNHEYVADFVESLFLYKDVAFVEVVSGNSAIKSQAAPGYTGKNFIYFSNSERFISESASIVHGKHEIGTIRISMSRQRIHRAAITNSIKILILLGALILAILFSVYFLSRNYIFKPLARLRSSARMIAQGDLDAPIEIQGRDEIGQLASTFKQMMTNVKSLTASRDDLDHEVQERKRAELALRHERDRAQTYLDIAGVVLIAINANQRVTLINRKGCDLLESDETRIIGHNWHNNFVAPEERESAERIFNQMMGGEADAAQYHESRIISRKGSKRLMAWYHTVLQDKDGKILGTLSSGEDITQRRRADNRLKASLEEKEILLREIHHRVKNNLQMIQSLLNLQAQKLGNPEFKQSIMEANNRIKSMALIHETLYRSKDIASLSIEDYFKDLVRHLNRIYFKNDATTDFKFRIDPLTFDLDTTIACGLIVNELITNVFKHAFPNNDGGQVVIAMCPVDGNNVELTVQDNGIGLPEDFEPGASQSLGIRLVSMLAEDQLQGSMKIAVTGGTRCCIRFPLKEFQGEVSS